MAYSAAQKLMELGVAATLAIEIQRQIAANLGNSAKLKELGLGGMGLCDYTAAAITAGTFNAVQATKYGLDTVSAPLMAKIINTPRNTVAPAITGTAQVGQTLTRSTGTWVGTPTPTFTTQWTANGVNISGATGATYVPVIGQIGQVIRAVVTATNANGVTVATSAPTAAVIAA